MKKFTKEFLLHTHQSFSLKQFDLEGSPASVSDKISHFDCQVIHWNVYNIISIK